jgi:hypothetical protein
MEVVNRPLNGSVTFVKVGDIYVSSDHWKIVVNVDLAIYDELITPLREDIKQMQENFENTTPLVELHQVETQLNLLETKFVNLREYLPKAEIRRGLINFGGTMLKALFGTATVMDLNQLHSTVDDLHKINDLIIHSLNSQVTYLKELDGTAKFNAEAITGLSDALKSIVNKAQEGFQDVAAKLAWHNKQKEAASILRRLEFEIVNLGLTISELQDAFQFALMGKFSFKFD